MCEAIPKCGACGISGVRIYRPYAEFLRIERLRCNGCVLLVQRGWYVPHLPAGART